MPVAEQDKAGRERSAIVPGDAPVQGRDQEEDWVEDDGDQEWSEDADEEPRPAKKAEQPAYYTWLAALAGAVLVWVIQALRR